MWGVGWVFFDSTAQYLVGGAAAPFQSIVMVVLVRTSSMSTPWVSALVWSFASDSASAEAFAVVLPLLLSLKDVSIVLVVVGVDALPASSLATVFRVFLMIKSLRCRWVSYVNFLLIHRVYVDLGKFGFVLRLLTCCECYGVTCSQNVRIVQLFEKCSLNILKCAYY